MIAIGMKNIEKYYGATKVLYDISLEINEGEKTALIGSNGCGKTTLFKIIAGIENYDNGMFALKKGIRVGYLEQMTDDYPKQKVYNVLLGGLEELLKIKDEKQNLEMLMTTEKNQQSLDKIMKKYGDLLEKYESLDGYNIDNKVKAISTGLQVPFDLFDKDFDVLSGGEKTRVLFARMLIQEPELLLLDEPTNHLDIEAVEWLEEYIREYAGTVVIVSHDRYFLDKAVKRIIEMEEGKCENYYGNYTYYVKEKERRMLLEFENYQDQQKKIKKMEESIKRLRDWGNRGENEKFFKRAASMQKALDKIEKLRKPVMEKKISDISFSVNSRSGKEVVVIKDLCKAYGTKTLFDEAQLKLVFKEKIGILGANGTGKSTLIKMLFNEIEPDRGEIKLGANVKIGYLEQNLQFEREELSILEEFRRRFGLAEGNARGILARFLFYKDSVFKKIKDLSGGEKTRLRLAELMYDDVNVLILDEPTNHLDIETREVLEDTLKDYGGTILFISHDRYFINKLAEKLYNIENGKLISYYGNYDYYKEKYMRKKSKMEVNKIHVETTKSNKKSHKNIIKPNKEVEISKIESEIQIIEQERDDIRKLLDNPMDSSDYMLLQSLIDELQSKEKTLEQLYENWEALSN